MAYQEMFAQDGVIKKLADFTGKDFIGKRVRAPLSVHDVVYILPMMTVSAAKASYFFFFPSSGETCY
jgi:leucyl-tRNA synthetase